LAVSDLKEIILVGHSYGGMIITGVADKMPHRIRRLVYWNTFVPNNDESVSDMLPPEYIALLDAIASERGDGSVVLPFPVWREAFINDADLDTAKRAYELLNPHPLKILTDKISLVTNPAEMKLAKSYLNCTEDTSLPHHYPWHPRLSQKLGLFRLVQVLLTKLFGSGFGRPGRGLSRPTWFPVKGSFAAFPPSVQLRLSGNNFSGYFGRSFWPAPSEWARTGEDVLWRRSKLGLHLDGDATRAIMALLAGCRAA